MHLIEDRDTGTRLVDGVRVYDPRNRRWEIRPPGAEAVGRPVSAEEALRWLQRDSGHPFRPPIGVIGPREATPDQIATAGAVGRLLARTGFVVICGGRQGVMEAVAGGVAAEGGISVGLLPDEHWSAANPHVTIPIATGIGVARNAIIARAAGCLIAIGGGYGTHSEVAFGLQFGRPVFGLLDAPNLMGVIRLPDVAALAAVLLDVATTG